MGTTCMGQSVLPNPRSCVLNRGVLHLISFQVFIVRIF